MKLAVSVVAVVVGVLVCCDATLVRDDGGLSRDERLSIENAYRQQRNVYYYVIESHSNFVSAYKDYLQRIITLKEKFVEFVDHADGYVRLIDSWLRDSRSSSSSYDKGTNRNLMSRRQDIARIRSAYNKVLTILTRQEEHLNRTIEAMDENAKKLNNAFRLGDYRMMQHNVYGQRPPSWNWKTYVEGYGSPSGEFWLGLDRIHRLLSPSCGGGHINFRLKAWDGTTASVTTYAKVEGPETGYRITVNHHTFYTDDDSIKLRGFYQSNGQKFSTVQNSTCALHHGYGGWWFKPYPQCSQNGISNINPNAEITKHSKVASGARLRLAQFYPFRPYESLQEVAMYIRSSYCYLDYDDERAIMQAS